ncbi:MAG: carbohydrate ABC transporter permease [Gammaproteobacteria bacterium]
MRGPLARWAFGALLCAIVAFAALPFAYAALASLASDGLAAGRVDSMVRWSLDNYRAIFAGQPFGRSLLNSVVVAGATTILSLALSCGAAYALGRVELRGRGLLLFTLLGASMLPQVAVLSGMFELVRSLGLYNRLGALSLAYLSFTVPFTAWTLTAFMREIPREIEEAAIMDGASPPVVVVRILLPLIGPAVAATGLLGFIAAWNEFLFALTFTFSEQQRTVPVAIAMISGSSAYELPWGPMMAACVIVTLPLVGLAVVFQRRIVSGLTRGAVKG